ncbi:MAG: hypothetical protein MI794_05975 [Pseudomonadales bacterium]|nr:hypothetical protein [Pseudomonadales bacterium]
MASRRNSESQRIERQMAGQVIDLFLEVVCSTDSDAGWRGLSLSGKVADFQGEVPRSSGFSGFSKVWEQCRLLNQWSDTHRMACVVVGRLSEKQREALCIDRSYRGRTKVAVDPFNPEQRVEIFWCDKKCAELLKCSVSAFRRRVHDGYRSLESCLAGYGGEQKVAA